MSSFEKVVNIGDHLSSDITPGQRPPVNSMEDSPAATPNGSPEFSNLEHSDMEQDNDSGGQWCISGNRKRNIGLVSTESWPRHVEPRGLAMFVGARDRAGDEGQVASHGMDGDGPGERGKGRRRKRRGGAEKQTDKRAGQRKLVHPRYDLRFGGLWSDVVIYYESYDISEALRGSATTYTPTTLQRLSFETSSTTAELVAIWAALESIKNITPPTKAVVLTDSRGALQQLKRVATGRPPPSIPRKLPRSEASLLHRLRTGCPHTAKRLHMYRRKTDPGCPTCGDPEDTTHALLLCPTHEDLRKVLLRSYAAVGLPHSTAQELLNPSGTRGIVEKAFRALLQYLRDSELSDRL
ncbi:hypothetical protein HPB47_006803 [Ixodes persulcatus]|uniref:Uncharacterized protein n=1 Tax=Ixodes persulcatus TaxID=34615 RepID=A0AC60P9C0_IXOPE|nr:hypothetical protein HPB47_006803 [Ixodes persulcatus]